MALLWGTEYLKNTLPEQMLDRFDEIKSDPHDKPGPDRLGTLPLYNGKTGELVAKIPGGIAVRVNREKLRKFLSDDVEIHFGKLCTKIEEAGDKVTVTFSDGSTATADTVVCADGIKGVGRTTLLGEEAAALSVAPCSFVNICNKYKPDQARFIRNTLDTMYKFGAHPDQPTLFMIVPVDIPDLDRPEEWKYQTCLSTWGATHSDSPAERLRVFKEAASKYAEPWRSAVAWLPDDTFIPKDTIKYWANPVKWPNWNGKVTLAGDGAHPIVPFRAQGLNNALQDAHNYVQALVAVRDGKRSLSEAITAYGDEVFERGAAENKLSNMWGPVLHNWDALMNTPMMKQGYGQTKKTEEPKPEDAAEAPEEEKKTKAPASSPEHGGDAAPAEHLTGGTTSAATMAHGQYTPSEEHKSLDLAAAQRPLTPTEVGDAELSKLRKENEALRRRNLLLTEKLKAIQALLSAQEVDVEP
ncbi:hypothetical protein, variant [Verruconis gallopava]|nr:hypothetical protein, variant [Verruconis gallopava]KIW00539.1 hypothetical protein, variant [Verruconis gallopava]